MKVLILSCGTGEGHNSAAKAIEEEFKRRNINVTFKDALSFGNNKAEKIVKSFFNGVAVKTPSLFGVMYKAGQVVSNPELKSPVYYANTIYSNNMFKYIISNKIDTVICTHLFPMEAMTYLKRNKKLNIKCYGVLTDYTAIPFIEETEMNKYFIPDKSLIKEFTRKKIDSNKLLTFGIPVSSKFNKKYDKEFCKKELSLPINKKIVLIMTGGVGCGNVIEMIDPLLRKTSDNVLILVLAGKNKELLTEINERYNKDKVRCIPFTDKVEYYMDASEIILSKPGGLSSTEAAVKNIPLIHTFPIPGCETKNASFFSKGGMSIEINDIDELVNAVNSLLENDKLRNKILLNQNKKINSNATKNIVDYVLKN